jgi:nitroreductase
MMNTFFELLKNRRSIRKFTAQAVEPEKIELLLKAALMAPSGKRVMPWHFVVVTEGELLQKLSGARTHGSQFLAGAPLAIVVLADTSKTDVWVEDAAIASAFIQLAAESIGLGSCWVQVRNREHTESESTDAYISKLLNIPERFAVENIIGIGYKDEQKKPFDGTALAFDKVSYNRF